MATIKINRVSPSFESNSGDEFESSAAAKDWLSADGLLNIEKLLQLDKKVTAQLKKVSVEAKPIGRGGRTVQFEVAGKKAAVARALRGRFPRKNPENVSIDVVEVPRSEGSMWRARIQVPAGSTITPKLRAEVSKLLTDVQEVKPTSVVAMSAKAKTAKFTAANDKKKDNFTYRSRRAVKVSERTRETATSRTLIRVFPKGLLPAAMQKQCEEALKAAQSHIKKIEKVKQGIQKDREKVRDQKAADYVKVVDEVMPMLEAQGIKANKMVLGKTMMGQQTLYVQLPSKQVITIGLSDVKAMRAASKLASESSASSASSAIGGVTYPNKLRAEDKMALVEVTKHVDGSESHKYALPMGYLIIENVGDDFGIKYQSDNRPARTIPLATLRALLDDLDFDPRDFRIIYKSFLGKFSADTVNKILGGSRGRPWGEFQ